MHIINITYKVPLENIDSLLNEHVNYLEEHYRLGHFHASGRKVPRTGGIILSKISDRKQLMEILEKDPFKLADVADYELIAFVPTKTCKELDFLIDQ